MNSFTRIVVVLLLCGLALAYLYQHNCSLRMTRRIVRLEKQRQLLAEERDSLNVVVTRLSGFARLDSLWVSEGRPAAPAPAPAEPTGGQVAAVGRRTGSN